MNAEDAVLLEQMLNYCDRIEQRVDKYGITAESFEEDSALFDMLLMPVFQIGELA